MKIDITARDRDLLIRVLKEKENGMASAAKHLDGLGERFADRAEANRNVAGRLASLRAALEATRSKREKV